VIDPARTLRGKSTSDDGSAIEVLAVIFNPEREKGQRDWSCLVRCPFLFSNDKRIVGKDRAQALELAEAFLRELLHHRGIDIETPAKPGE
jgi:hypothetical protein